MTDLRMSERTRAELLADIDLLPEQNRQRLLFTLGSLAAEIEQHCRSEAAEALRHDWYLATMLNR